MKGSLKRATKADKVLLSVLLILSLSGILFIKEVLPKGRKVLIEVEGRPLYVFPIEKDRILSIDGPIGKTIVEIRDQRVRVQDSPCSKKLCVKQGWVENGIIICLPNKIVITIGNGNDEGITIVDAITG